MFLTKDGAKELKKRIKDLGYKASVGSSVYSMGSSISAKVFGDVTPDHKEIIKKMKYDYQEGSFDGMTDSYDYTNKSEKACAKYVFIDFEKRGGD